MDILNGVVSPNLDHRGEPHEHAAWMAPGRDEIRRGIALLHAQSQMIGLVVRDKDNSPRAIFYFADLDQMTRYAMEACQQEPRQLYALLNTPDPELPVRYAQELQKGSCVFAKATDIIRLRFFCVSVAPVRPAGSCATKEQLELARGVVRCCLRGMREAGLPEPVIVLDGNEYILLYRTDLANDEIVSGLIERSLTTLSVSYSTDSVRIATTVDAAREILLPGSLNITCGQQVRVLKEPEQQQPLLTQEQLQALAAKALHHRNAADTPAEERRQQIEAYLARVRINVPEQLLALPVWLTHQDKIPVYVTTGKNRHGTLDSPEDRAQLVPFEQAAAALLRWRHMSGLGIALGAVPGHDLVLSGVDLDHCYDAQGVLDERAQAVLLAAVETYAERSPSDTGLHAIGLGDVGTNGPRPGQRFEIYSGGKFFTVTGNRIGSCNTLGELAPVARTAREKYRAVQAGTQNDSGSASGEGLKVKEGGRNDHLSRHAFGLRKKGMSVEQILENLRTLNRTVCAPPLSEQEVQQIAQGKGRIEPDCGTYDPAKADFNTADGREAHIDWLAGLPHQEYARRREADAERMGIKPKDIEKAVRDVHKRNTASHNDAVDDRPTITLTDPEPWSDPVDGVVLLNGIKKEVQRYVSLSDHAATAATLWALHTWCLPAFFISPFLLLRSPQKRCGKTTLMLVLAQLVRRALIATSATPAAIFRVIETHEPSLLLDEAETWMAENSELRGILNGGHTRATAFVLRAVGDDHEPHQFPTFCPKLIAGIGRQADTMEDRSIIIAMRRKLPGEPVERLRQDQFDLSSTRQQCLRWAIDHADVLKRSDPQVPPGLNDRAADCWRPLLAIAEEVGGDWPAMTRKAVLAVSVARGADDTDAIQLLQDIRAVFAGAGAPAAAGTQATPLTKISSFELVQQLVAMPDRPWGAMSSNRGQPLSQHTLAKILQGFEVSPRNIAIEGRRPKGYLAKQFEEPFARYLADVPADEAVEEDEAEAVPPCGATDDGVDV